MIRKNVNKLDKNGLHFSAELPKFCKTDTTRAQRDVTRIILLDDAVVTAHNFDNEIFILFCLTNRQF